MKKSVIITREASQRYVNTLCAWIAAALIIVVLLVMCFDSRLIALIGRFIACIGFCVCVYKAAFSSSRAAAMSLSEEHPAGVACRGWFILLNIKEEDIHGLFRVFQKGRGTPCGVGNMDTTVYKFCCMIEEIENRHIHNKLPRRDYFVLENDSMLAVPCGAAGKFAVVFHCTGDQAKSWPISVYGDAKIQTVENEGSYRADFIQLRRQLAGS